MAIQFTKWQIMKIHKYLFSIATFVFITSLCNAQSLERQAIGSTGGYAEAANVTTSFTVGEAVTTTQTAGTIILTQGFQQSESNSVGIEDLTQNIRVMAYPNPTTAKIFVEVESADAGVFQVEVLNTNGQIISVGKQAIPGNTSTKFELDFSLLAAAQYFVSIKDTKGFSKTIQINKSY